MDIEQLRNFVLSLPEVEESFPFGEETLVFKIKGKIFLLTGLDRQPLQFNVKCNPDEAIELREEFLDAVLPGYHMNKKHWNTIVINGQLNNKQLQLFITQSYYLVRGKK
jgi:predicted DNA-binding protein (MmcQ/YjbR family)